MIPLTAKVVYTLAAVIVGSAFAILKPRYDEWQRRRQAMPYEYRSYDDTADPSNDETADPSNDETDQSGAVGTDVHTCSYCRRLFNGNERRPRVLPCMHTFCEACLGRRDTGGNKFCPNCGHDWSDIMVSDIVSVHQLIPSTDLTAVVTGVRTCSICRHLYNSRERSPQVLPCSHSFCQSCLTQQETSGNKSCRDCGADWSARSVSDLVNVQQLIP